MRNKLVLPAFTAANETSQTYVFNTFYNRTRYTTFLLFRLDETAIYDMELTVQQKNGETTLEGTLHNLNKLCSEIPRMFLSFDMPVKCLRGHYHIDCVLPSPIPLLLRDMFAIQLLNEYGDELFFRLDAVEGTAEGEDGIYWMADLCNAHYSEKAFIQVSWQNGVDDDALGKQYDIYCDIVNALVDWFGKYGEEYILDLSRYVPKD